eukprot:869331-Rhodomonas_salina.1
MVCRARCADGVWRAAGGAAVLRRCGAGAGSCTPASPPTRGPRGPREQVCKPLLLLLPHRPGRRRYSWVQSGGGGVSGAWGWGGED